ncbi:MAG: hypothetical protein EBQ92_03965 [Proteobacteria bacterium]|nr:hypothetical protein [Pseudomonadota bacterium]
MVEQQRMFAESAAGTEQVARIVLELQMVEQQRMFAESAAGTEQVARIVLELQMVGQQRMFAESAAGTEQVARRLAIALILTTMIQMATQTVLIQ